MMEYVFLLVILALVFAFVFVEIKTLRRWKGVWRFVAFLPILALAYIITQITVDILRDRTAHNLWPFEIVMWSVGGLVFLGLLHLIHKLTTPKTSSNPQEK